MSYRDGTKVVTKVTTSRDPALSPVPSEEVLAVTMFQPNQPSMHAGQEVRSVDRLMHAIVSGGKADGNKLKLD